jgi:hypothetical protein
MNERSSRSCLKHSSRTCRQSRLGMRALRFTSDSFASRARRDGDGETTLSCSTRSRGRLAGAPGRFPRSATLERAGGLTLRSLVRAYAVHGAEVAKPADAEDSRDNAAAGPARKRPIAGPETPVGVRSPPGVLRPALGAAPELQHIDEQARSSSPASGVARKAAYEAACARARSRGEALCERDERAESRAATCCTDRWDV